MVGNQRMPDTLRGVLSVLSAPFDESGTLFVEDITRQVEAAVAFGIAGVCLPAYGTEFYKLTDEERVLVVKAAADASSGRIPVFGQANHDAGIHAANLAARLRDAGADHISFALPRRFAIPEPDLLKFAAQVCDAVDVPILVQDFNPGGATVGADFCGALRDQCPNFTYIKLEEPLLGPKLRAIKDVCEGEVGVFEGWGGMYLPELIASGIDGAMPGLGHADAMNAIWQAGIRDDLPAALDIFERLLPHISFSLQNLELYLYVEKQLLRSRGIITHSHIRAVTATPDTETVAHAKILNDRVLELIRDLNLSTRPIT
jgi:dihydrodipicolinate synthase/N-acetylneuraminate lyase